MALRTATEGTWQHVSEPVGLPFIFPTNGLRGVWRNKNDAIKGGTGPWHQQARAIIPRMYEHIDVRGVRLIIEDDVASWTFAPY